MRTLILSDIHGNLEALNAVLAAAGEVDSVWNLGDTVGYGASPNEVVERIRPIATRNVRGNHDKVASGVMSVDTFNPAAKEAALWTQQQLSVSSIEWLRELPAGPVTCRNFTLAHGSPIDEDVYILNIRDAWSPLESMQTRATFFGHTHLQGGFGWDNGRWFGIKPQHGRAEGHSQWTLPLEESRRYLLNPGSVGQPRDHDSRAAYIILDDTLNTVTFHREPYDIELAQGRILLAGLPERLAKRLREGK